jgi:hypothetical protein
LFLFSFKQNEEIAYYKKRENIDEKYNILCLNALFWFLFLIIVSYFIIYNVYILTYTIFVCIILTIIDRRFMGVDNLIIKFGNEQTTKLA